MVARARRSCERVARSGGTPLRRARVDPHESAGHRRPVVRSRTSPSRGPAAWATSRSAAKGVHAFVDPADSGPYQLIGRHGSLTRAEMLVPLLSLQPRPESNEDLMSDTTPSPIERGEIVEPRLARDKRGDEYIEQPAKVMRVGTMMKSLLEEVRSHDARRREQRPPPRHLRDLGHRARLGACRPICAPSSVAWPCRSPMTPRSRPPRPRSASRRRSWSGGSRGSSRASRPRCSRSRWRRSSSSRTCAAELGPGGPAALAAPDRSARKDTRPTAQTGRPGTYL